MATIFLLLVCLAGAKAASLSVGNDSITIESLHINSDIRHRFSETLISSLVHNNADFPQDVTFDVRLPNEAFISAFAMLIDGVIFPGRVEEKAAANRRFEAAVQAGQSAGKVATTSSRETNDFTVTINVAASSYVTFNLTYHELLQRRVGLYEHVIHVNPGQIVPDLRVVVFLNESREITELSVPEIRGDRLTAGVLTGTNKFALISSQSPTAAEIVFSPTPDQQREYSDRGVAGQFIVNYDVDHTLDPEGEVLVSDGYFVHFFAPESLPPMGKRIMFVLDTSGSMSGRKNQQLREALIFILGELRPQDEFGILLFSNTASFWAGGELIPASTENIQRAKIFANTIPASGGTNINDALSRGLTALSFHETKPSMIFFLTDGQATVGVTASEAILQNVRETHHIRQSIYSLAFGNGADFGLLQKISAQNQGFARRIFEDADAALQLSGFYNEISTPILSEVFMLYISNLLDQQSLTQTDFPTVFGGSEIIVAGRYNASAGTPDQLTVIVEGSQATGSVFYRNDYDLPVDRPRSFIGTTVPHTSSASTVSPIGSTSSSRTTPKTTTCIPGMCGIPKSPTPASSTPKLESRPIGFLERLWVYLTIKQLIKKTFEEQSGTSPAAIAAKEEALRLSLKYQFVTQFTSMVVTKPDEKQAKSNFGTTTPPQSQFFTTTTTRVPFTIPFVTTGRRLPFHAQTTLPHFATFTTPSFQPTFSRPSSHQPTTTFTSPHFRPRTTTTTTTTTPRHHPTTPFTTGTVSLGSFTPPHTTLGRLSTLSGTTSSHRTTTRGFSSFTTPPATTPAQQIIGFPSGFNIEVSLTSPLTPSGFLCLDLTAPSSSTPDGALLMNDTNSGVVVTGELHTRTYDGLRKLESVQVRVNDTEMLRVSLKSVVIQGKSYRWWQLNSVKENGVTITADDGIELVTPSSVLLTFHKVGIESRRSLSSPFIAVGVRNTTGLPSGASGAVGAVLEMQPFTFADSRTVRYMVNGVQKTAASTIDVLGDGTECHRVTNKGALTDILGL